MKLKDALILIFFVKILKWSPIATNYDDESYSSLDHLYHFIDSAVAIQNDDGTLRNLTQNETDWLLKYFFVVAK
jgi:hypothetical protein